MKISTIDAIAYLKDDIALKEREIIQFQEIIRVRKSQGCDVGALIKLVESKNISVNHNKWRVVSLEAQLKQD